MGSWPFTSVHEFNPHDEGASWFLTDEELRVREVKELAESWAFLFLVPKPVAECITPLSLQ